LLERREALDATAAGRHHGLERLDRLVWLIWPPRDGAVNRRSRAAAATTRICGVSGRRDRPRGQGGAWDLVFSEELDGSALNAGRWHTCFWWASITCAIESNNELQLYGQRRLIQHNLGQV
jgi:hypothetical protein